ncbi:MAG: cation:proton antiporter [Actinomycetota bacterium]|nr:cation:proton antiporter [Actinomycetota bacterium]
MTVDVLLACAGLLAIGVAPLSGRLRRLPLSEPVLGLLAGVLLGPAVLGVLRVPSPIEEPGWLHEAARILLAISVMAVALRYSIRDVRLRLRSVLLLLAVVMPVMAALTAGVAGVALGVGLGSAVLLGAALCPTDPVLASNVVTGKPAERDLPARNRQLLSLESGANDGLALPLVILAIAIASPVTVGTALTESLWQVGGAVVIGIAIGWFGGRALRAGEQHGAAEPGPMVFFTAVLALAVLGIARLAQTDGVLAVFVCGLAFNAVATGRQRGAELPIDEAVNRFLLLPLFVAFGAALPWQAWAELGWRGPLLVAGVLVLRRLPILLILRRPLALGWVDALYVGWFGPIGVSALFYLTLEAERLDVDPVVLAAGTLVVAASTVVHGMTATPGRVLYRRATGQAARSASSQR